MKAKQTICAALAVLALGTSAAAYQVPYTNGTFHVVTQETVNNDPEMQAEMLKKLGLFLGTNKGFELDRAMTRDEAAAMLTRFLGGAQEAEGGKYTHPFTDVPDWADGSVGWLYQNKLTYGVSATKYGAKQTISADEFARFLSRALCGDDSRKDEVLPTDEAKSFAARTGADGFRREDAVALSTRALNMAKTGGGTLAQALVEKGAFTAETFAEAAWDIYPPSYDYGKNGALFATLAGVPYGEGSEPELTAVTGSVHTDLPYFYAYRIADQVTVYQVDWKTMAAKAVITAEPTGDHSDPAYLTTAGGKDYLLIGDSRVGKNRLYSVSGGTAKLELDESKLGGQKPEWDGTSLKLENGVCLIDATGVTIRETAGNAEVLWTGESTYVTQTVTDAGTTIANIDKTTGKTLQSYTVPQDISGEPRMVTNQFDIFYGEAGCYRIDSNGKLTQVYDGAAPQAVYGDWRGTDMFILSHDPGVRIGENGGDRVVLASYSGEFEPSVIIGREYGITFTDMRYSLEMGLLLTGKVGQETFQYEWRGSYGLYVASESGEYTAAESAEQKRLDAIQSK